MQNTAAPTYILTRIMLTTRNDKNLITDLYKRYHDDLKRYFLSYLHNEMDADDMLQNVFVRIMNVDVIDNTTAKSLLFTTAHRMVIDELRHRACVKQATSDYLHSASLCESGPARRVEATNLLSLVEKRINEMPAQRARIFSMYRIDEMKAKEIAQKAGLSQRTVEHHIYMATQEIRQMAVNL